MHEPLRSHLEEILQGRGLSSVRDAVQAHLASCPPCAAELNELQHSAKILRVLRQPEAPELRAGFYARVMQRVEAQGKPSFWYLLLDPVFGRRLVYGTCAAFLLMASFLLATSSSEQPDIAQTPVQIMVQPSTGAETPRPEFGDDIQRDREHFLVTLASFAE
jgi:anti-sigma factor RsiW